MLYLSASLSGLMKDHCAFIYSNKLSFFQQGAKFQTSTRKKKILYFVLFNLYIFQLKLENLNSKHNFRI